MILKSRESLKLTEVFGREIDRHRILSDVEDSCVCIGGVADFSHAVSALQ